MRTLLWLDDVRNPFKEHKVSVQYVCEEYMEKNSNEVEVIWVKTQPDFEKYINENGMPDFISFDNDLGVGHGEGYSCAKFVVDYCLDHNLHLPGYYAHSMNTVARDNINNLFENFKKNTAMKLTKQQIKDELSAKIRALRTAPDRYRNFFVGSIDFYAEDVPLIVEKAREIVNLVHAEPEDGGYYNSLHRKGYNSSYPEKTLIPMDLIPKVKSTIHQEKEYPMDCGFDAYALFIRSFTHDFNSFVNNLGYLYHEHERDKETFPSNYVIQYALFIQPFVNTMIRCCEHLANDDVYENDVFYVARHNMKDGLYKTYQIRMQEIHFDDKVAYTFEIPTFRKDNIFKKFHSRTVHYFEEVR